MNTTIKKIKISVGIPAFNEEKNISGLLKSVLAQKIFKNALLLEVLVALDGSTDNTALEVKKIKSKKIKIIQGATRKGKNFRLNQIFKLFKGDVLVLMDADIMLNDKIVLESIVKPFGKSSILGLVAGNVQPLSAQTLPETAFNNFVYSLNFAKDRINKGNNVYSVRGPLLALSRDFAKNVKLPMNVPDDRYLYFACIDNGFSFLYGKTAKAWFKSPKTFEEQISQSVRFIKDTKNLFKNLNPKALKKEYHIPFRLKLAGLVLQVFKNPIAYLAMKYIQIKSLTKNLKQKNVWIITKTSKDLSI